MNTLVKFNIRARHLLALLVGVLAIAARRRHRA